MKIKNSLEEAVDSYGDDHVGSSSDNPVRPDAFELSNQEKIELIEEKVADILHILGMDLTDDSLKGTPNRVAKMYVDEILEGYTPRKNLKHLLLVIVTNTVRFWLKKILLYIQPASIIYSLLSEKLT